MSRSRWFLLVLALLFGMTPLLASPGSVGAAPNPHKPIVLAVDDTFIAPNLTAHCGFDVTAHVVGTFTFKVKSSGVELDRYRLQYVFTGPGGSQAVHRI